MKWCLNEFENYRQAPFQAFHIKEIFIQLRLLLPFFNLILHKKTEKE